MSRSKKRLIYLLEAYTSHNIGADELEELTEYISNSSSMDAELTELMRQFWAAMPEDAEMEVPGEAVFENISKHPRFLKPEAKVITFYKWNNLLKYAAVLVLLLSAALLVYRPHFGSSAESTRYVKTVIPSKEIKPGVKKAVLTLSDGSEVILQDAGKGTLAHQGNARLEQNNGQLLYKDHSAAGHDLQLSMQNKITTPKGGEYQLVLSDGTAIWLNTGSSISYPVAFAGTERRVKITGEVYFEVAKNAKMPFIVEANGTEVKVLGTHFNVSAYADDREVRTTLVEGSVKVSKNGQQALLKPDQEARAINGTNRISVQNVDATEALAWKNGTFLFNNEDIKTVMKVVSRWYDIDVTYKGDLANKTFGGTISRFESFEKLLKTLELTGAIHFKIEGRRVIVMP
ncbi:DUF4974 domain-containing protein [Pedobacter sp. MC2016-14]|uniref:FecR family protein n=1 Tax=Pedobacter sp. MC2016-14 TaxID=2897327 RepID=UPI001E502553|nr:FecR family protein [Pedobacter sp. MC2016-14]MCD0488185.1 DUF4974 domain-containing protein [Pedobacter sp. MC2016-14]